MLASHGDIKVTLLGNVISVVLIGSFNDIAVNNYVKEIKAIVLSLKEKPFVMIIDDTKFEGCTPQGFKVLDIFNAWLSQTQLKAKAFIIDNDVNKQIIESRTPSLALQNICFFSNYQDANEWIKNYI